MNPHYGGLAIQPFYSTASSPATTLESLPNELLTDIARHLDGKSRNEFRLTSRKLSTAAYAATDTIRPRSSRPVYEYSFDTARTVTNNRHPVLKPNPPLSQQEQKTAIERFAQGGLSDVLKIGRAHV